MKTMTKTYDVIVDQGTGVKFKIPNQPENIVRELGLLPAVGSPPEQSNPATQQPGPDDQKAKLLALRAKIDAMIADIDMNPPSGTPVDQGDLPAASDQTKRQSEAPTISLVVLNKRSGGYPTPPTVDKLTRQGDLVQTQAIEKTNAGDIVLPDY